MMRQQTSATDGHILENIIWYKLMSSPGPKPLAPKPKYPKPKMPAFREDKFSAGSWQEGPKEVSHVKKNHGGTG